MSWRAPDEADERKEAAERALKLRIEGTRQRIGLTCWLIGGVIGTVAYFPIADAIMASWHFTVNVFALITVVPALAIAHGIAVVITRARLKRNVRAWATAIVKFHEVELDSVQYLIDFWEKGA